MSQRFVTIYKRSQGFIPWLFCFSHPCAARIDELFHLRGDKVFLNEGKVELLGKGGKMRRIRFLRREIFDALDCSKRFIYLTSENGETWKDGLERVVRKSCDELEIRRRGVHGFRGTAACEFVRIKESLGYTEMEARRELAQWLGHNPHRTEVTYAYVPRRSERQLEGIFSTK